jgi:hypothetical protein
MDVEACLGAREGDVGEAALCLWSFAVAHRFLADVDGEGVREHVFIARDQDDVRPLESLRAVDGGELAESRE